MHSSSELVSVQDLKKCFGSVTAVDGISFSLKQGEVLALLGANGSGKTTTLKCILGLARPTSGQVSMFGTKPESRVGGLHGASAVLTSDALHPGRTGWNTVLNVALACSASKKRVQEVLDMCRLSKAESKRRVKGYSTGMKQRLSLAVALVSDPRLLVLDEPEVGLDPEGQIWLRNFEAEFTKNGGTLLVSSHNLYAVANTSSRILFYTKGKIAAEVDLEKTPMQAKELEEMYLSVSSGFSRNAFTAHDVSSAHGASAAPGASLAYDASNVDDTSNVDGASKADGTSVTDGAPNADDSSDDDHN